MASWSRVWGWVQQLRPRPVRLLLLLDKLWGQLARSCWVQGQALGQEHLVLQQLPQLQRQGPLGCLWHLMVQQVRSRCNLGGWMGLYQQHQHRTSSCRVRVAQQGRRRCRLMPCSWTCLASWMSRHWKLM